MENTNLKPDDERNIFSNDPEDIMTEAEKMSSILDENKIRQI